MAFISILTDFGLLDGYPGIMKGVIYTIAPDAKIADVTHLIRPQDVRDGALALSRSYRYFPVGSIHIAVVDPGVGTARRPLAMQLGDHFFVGPDNGLFTLVIQEAQEHGWPCKMVVTNHRQYWLPVLSHVFHGRDVFAPVAAHLAAGVPLEALGDPLDDPLMLDFPRPQRTPQGWQAHVVAIDHFGNLSTDLLDSDLGTTRCTIQIAGREIHGLVRAFGERPIGELVAMIGTDHDLSIAIVNGDAASELGVSVGGSLTVLV